LWQRYFLSLFRGEKEPKEPRKPLLEHKVDRQVVPYTPAEMLKRTAAYDVKKAIWDKTMEVKCVFSNST
jgi:hypothetical protein